MLSERLLNPNEFENCVLTTDGYYQPPNRDSLKSNLGYRNIAPSNTASLERVSGHYKIFRHAD